MGATVKAAARGKKAGRRRRRRDAAAGRRRCRSHASSVDVSLSHLDRTFDYLVSQEQDAAAQPGVRVRVRFAGALVGGFILERVEKTDHEGKLSFLERVLGSEPVLSPEVAARRP